MYDKGLRGRQQINKYIDCLKSSKKQMTAHATLKLSIAIYSYAEWIFEAGGMVAPI
jgi:hypothetical protein